MAIQTNIYDDQIYYALTFQNKFTEILEPDGWNKITNRIPRDPKYMAFWSDFIEDKYGLKFPFAELNSIPGGGQYLKEIVETIGLGPESIVYFEFGIKRSNSYEMINQWRVNLNEYTEGFYGSGFGYVMTSIEKMPFQSKLRSRLTSPCTINGYATMDGELLTPISTSRVRLHSKTLLETSRSVSDFPKISNEIVTFFDSYVAVQPDQENFSSQELNEVFVQPFGFIVTGSRTPAAAGVPASPLVGGLDGVPFTDVINQYTAQYAGTGTFNWSGGGTFYSFDAFSVGCVYEVTPRLVQKRGTVVVSVVVGTTVVFPIDTGVAPIAPIVRAAPFDISGMPDILPSVTGSDRVNFVTRLTGYTFNETFSNIVVQKDDLIYVQLIMCPFNTTMPPIDIPQQWDDWTNDISYSQLTTSPPTISDGFRIIDLLRQLTENITGQKNAVIAPFFEEGGPGWDYVMLNGYGIRNYGGIAYKFKKDLDSLLQDLITKFCLGVGIKKINNVEYLNIQSLEDFFRERVIITLHETLDWKNKVSTKYTFNKIDIGYEKFEGLNIKQQDEFCTSGTFLLPFIKSLNNTLTLKSKSIAAGYIIEDQRRNQFLVNPPQTLSFDEDSFIVATCPNPMIWNITEISFSNVFSSVEFASSSMNLLPGDKFIVTSSTGGSGANNGIEFRILKQFSGYPRVGADRYYVNPIPTTDLTNNNVLSILPSSPDQLFSESNQPFEVCAGVADPSTIYNGRLSIKHLLYNWRPFIGISTYFLDPANIEYQSTNMVTNLIKMNSLFTSQFRASEPNKGNIGDKLTIEIKNETVRDYTRNGESLFTPLAAEFKAKIGWNDMNTIRQALSGELGDDTKDYGGIVAKDFYGDYWFCHIMDINYDLVKQIATFDVQKVKKVVI